MGKFGVNEKGEYKYQCPYCYCQIEGNKITRTKIRVNITFTSIENTKK